MMSHPGQTLSKQIEHLVREHIEATQRAANEAVARAFASSASSPRSVSARAPRRTNSQRRGPEEMAALAERLYAAVVAEPGETMAVLAPAAGATSRELQRPVMILKNDGRVRSAGQRHQTRYYPTAAGR